MIIGGHNPLLVFQFIWSFIYSETFLNRTVNKPEFCIIPILYKVPVKEIFVNLTCINRTPVYSEQKSGSQGCSVWTGFTVVACSMANVGACCIFVNCAILLSNKTVAVIYEFMNQRNIFFSSLCQRQCELLPSLGVHRLLYVVRRMSSVVCWLHILIFSSETAKWSEAW